jgi:hypothetical protein
MTEKGGYYTYYMPVILGRAGDPGPPTPPPPPTSPQPGMQSHGQDVDPMRGHEGDRSAYGAPQYGGESQN